MRSGTSPRKRAAIPAPHSPFLEGCRTIHAPESRKESSDGGHQIVLRERHVVAANKGWLWEKIYTPADKQPELPDPSCRSKRDESAVPRNLSAPTRSRASPRCCVPPGSSRDDGIAAWHHRNGLC